MCKTKREFDVKHIRREGVYVIRSLESQPAKITPRELPDDYVRPEVTDIDKAKIRAIKKACEERKDLNKN